MLITPTVIFNAILITFHPPHTRIHTHRLYTRAHPLHHTLRDTCLFFPIKEIALLCWLFYLRPWLPLCAPDHAVTENRRRAAGLIGAWDARGGATKLVGRRGEPLMGLPVCGSPLSPLFAALGSDATHLLVCLFLRLSSNHLHKTTVWFVRELFLQIGKSIFL